eukprot:gene12382-12516_t
MDAQIIKAAAKGREAAERREQERRKYVLVLILRHLLNFGYLNSYQQLEQESHVSLSKFEVADNVDLMRILQEYEEYNEAKFGRRPVLVRKVTDEPPHSGPQNSSRSAHTIKATSNNLSGSDDEGFHQYRLLKPLPSSLLGELQELGSAISRDIYLDSPNVHWSDIAGLDEAKRLLKESVVLPLKYPDLFTGLLAPWRGLLLYGPPGTGKTLLAKAVATQCQTTFFNISASSIISKWRGDSEKLVRVLFDLARYHAPSTIFLDEVDALMGARGAEGEHEASRRMKTELLIQMDGLARSRPCGTAGTHDSQSPDAQVFVLAATNMPWELDMALLRRLEKRILVPLPGLAARRAMLGQLLSSRLGPDVDLDKLAAATEGYSGSDVTVVAKEAAMRPLRRLMAVLEPVTASDIAAALAVTKPSAQAYEAQYQEFSIRFGQTL